MISISTDLFQTIALGLMLVILIALIALLSAINGLKKSLGSGARPADTSAYGDTTSYPAYGSASGADTGYGYGSQPTPQPAAAARPEVATSYVPVSQAAQPAAAQPTTMSTATPTLTGTEPEEQPFEREGRWWFKRGGDLLVYDEGTGQWVAAGEGAAGGTAPVTAGSYTTPTAAGDPGEGWRCSSCGAINGSTATVCRMCFTPR